MSSAIRTAVTVSLVPQAQGGPFVYWHDLDSAMRSAAELGFDAIELFAAGPEAIDPGQLGQKLAALRDEGDRKSVV